ncbi:endonuclease III domain-containing protein [Halobacterium noricense]|uniref:endonuclease III domain-containing protein n=1 Tax=Halobacterium noricense TaxID=223182 RepID=UPI001E4FF510|nr:endonuclease III [Halobacterium noricense]UHH25897.1 endonuclease III [Halobacterium noricense]
MDDEPAENISGGDAAAGRFTEFEPGNDTSRADAVVDRLGDMYWQKAYGGRDAFECLVRTILSQNTSDVASQPAHDALMDRYDAGQDLAATLADAHQDELAETISSAGLYNQKSETLIRIAGRICEEYGGEAAFDEFVRTGRVEQRSTDGASSEGRSPSDRSSGRSPREDGETASNDPDEVRDALLDMKGVGPKTADCVLLFAGGRDGVFPVDTHVHRIARRLGLAAPDADHEDVREALEAEVQGEKCGFGHTAMIQFGREYCSARKPACLDGPEACPLYDLCDRVGVDELAEEVVDPAEAAD